jgi:hypothetical protein
MRASAERAPTAERLHAGPMMHCRTHTMPVHAHSPTWGSSPFIRTRISATRRPVASRTPKIWPRRLEHAGCRAEYAKIKHSKIQCGSYRLSLRTVEGAFRRPVRSQSGCLGSSLHCHQEVDSFECTPAVYVQLPHPMQQHAP